MTARESEILEILKERPMISQNELADSLGITRSSVAVHITNLTKKGYIKGKGYIIDDSGRVLVIGGANADMQGFPYGVFKMHDSNPGKIEVSVGGVGRNIADNLTRLGVRTKLITAIGDDAYGSAILKEAQLIGLDMSDSLVCAGESTSIYLSILNEKGEMIAALSHMDVLDKLNVDFLKRKNTCIKDSPLIIADTNLSFEALDYLTTTYRDIPFLLDTVSTSKAMKAKDIIGRFHTIKPNKIEAEILTGIPLEKPGDEKRAEEFFLNSGVKRIFLSLGEDGLFYSDGENSGLLERKPIQVVNTTGAGDAFVAAVAYAHTQGWGVREAAEFAQAAAVLALSHPDTINPSMSVETVNNCIKEN